MDDKPYNDVIINNSYRIREFDPTRSNSNDYVWHRDLNDRNITIIDGEGWMFQFDNELPQSINIGDKIFVPKMVYHRLLIGKTKLKLHIEELE